MEVFNMEKIDVIYGLYTNINNEKKYFYVGHSNDIERRLKEHKGDAKKEKYCKGQFMARLIENNIEWNYDILKEIPAGCICKDYEDWYVVEIIRAALKYLICPTVIAFDG
jgi:hypothetical protein